MYEKIVQLKLPSSDGKKYETDCANTESMFRIIQSIPSKKAESFKRWLAKVGYERINKGRLVSYSQIFGNSGSISSGGSGCGFIFKDKNEEYFIDDLYCIDPRCNCETAHLLFIKPDKENTAVFNSFIARLDFNKGFKIDENTLSEKDARKKYKKCCGG